MYPRAVVVVQLCMCVQPYGSSCTGSASIWRMYPRAVVVVQLYSRTGPAVPVGRPMYWLWCESAAVLSIWTMYPRAVGVVQLYSRTGPAVPVV
jgi:hypothetical protein